MVAVQIGESGFIGDLGNTRVVVLNGLVQPLEGAITLSAKCQCESDIVGSLLRDRLDCISERRIGLDLLPQQVISQNQANQAPTLASLALHGGKCCVLFALQQQHRAGHLLRTHISRAQRQRGEE